MDLRTVSKLASERDLMGLLELAPPTPPLQGKPAQSTLIRCSQSCLDAWMDVVFGRVDIPWPLKSRASSLPDWISSEQDVWDRLFHVLGAYYNVAIHRLISTRSLPKAMWLPGLSIPDLKTFATAMAESTIESSHARWAQSLLVDYLTCLSAVLSFVVFRVPGLPHPGTAFEAVAHESLVDLHTAQVVAPAEECRRASTVLLYTCMALLAGTYRKSVAVSWESQRKRGPFSAIRLEDVVPLATRQVAVMKRYGSRHVARVFEQQLSLIMQSLGFLVVSSRVGQRFVDLLCLAPDPFRPYTFLLEAKTSKTAYKLPADDKRAILDYVAQTRAALQTLPSLEFVLIVGPDPAPSLDNRLSALEASSSPPIRVRYLPARELVNLREGLAGPVHTQTFSNALATSSHLLTEEFASASITAQERLGRAYGDLVRVSLESLEPSPDRR